jgi:hypothetical protein
MSIILTKPQITYLRIMNETGMGIDGATNTRNALLDRNCLYMDDMGKVYITQYGIKAAAEAITEKEAREKAEKEGPVSFGDMWKEITKATDKFANIKHDEGYTSALAVLDEFIRTRPFNEELINARAYVASQREDEEW